MVTFPESLAGVFTAGWLRSYIINDLIILITHPSGCFHILKQYLLRNGCRKLKVRTVPASYRCRFSHCSELFSKWWTEPASLWLDSQTPKERSLAKKAISFLWQENCTDHFTHHCALHHCSRGGQRSMSYSRTSSPLITDQKAVSLRKVKTRQRLISQMERQRLPMKQQSASTTPQSWQCPWMAVSHLCEVTHTWNLFSMTKCFQEIKPKCTINLLLMTRFINSIPVHIVLQRTQQMLHWQRSVTLWGPRENI